MRFLRRYFLVSVFTMFTAIALNAQWVRTNGPHTELTLALASGSNDKGDTTIFAGTYNGGVYRSTDYGDSWTEIAHDTSSPSNRPGFTSKDIQLLAACSNGFGGMCIFAVDSDRKLFRSFNSDTNWVNLDTCIANNFVYSIIINDTNIIIGTDKGIFRSTNNGTNWTVDNNELSLYAVYSLLATHDAAGSTNLFATTSDGLFLSIDNCITWTAVNTNSGSYYGPIAMCNTKDGYNLFSVSEGRVFRSTNKGVNWDIINDVCPSYEKVTCLAAHDTIVYAAVYNRIHYSVNGGNSWGGEKDWACSYIECMEIGGSFLFTGTSSPWDLSGSVWRRPLSEMLTDFTDVEDKDKLSSQDFNLSQNYPNPFNPTTTISFNLPSRSFVSLKVFDGLGREVAELLSEEFAAGNHTQHWNASEFSNGIYYYRLQAGSYFQTRKLVLLK